MANLIVLNGGRDKKISEQRTKLIASLKELLTRAESGDLKALCYAALNIDGQTVSLGALQGDSCGLHEMIGLSQMLSDSLLTAARD